MDICVEVISKPLLIVLIKRYRSGLKKKQKNFSFSLRLDVCSLLREMGSGGFFYVVWIGYRIYAYPVVFFLQEYNQFNQRAL